MPEFLRNDDPVRLVIIGAGKMAQFHAAAFDQMDDVAIVGIASRTGTSAQRLAEQYHVPYASADWQYMIEVTHPHACVVSVSHSLNEEITRGVIESGVHVLAEKPVAFTSEGAHALAQLAKKHDVLALAAMNRRFFPHMGAAANYVRFWGDIHDIQLIAPDSASWPRASGRIEAFVYDQWLIANTLHAFDLLRLVGGEITSIAGYARIDQTDDRWSIGATLNFENGAMGYVTSFSDSTRTDRSWELHIHTDGVSAHLNPLELCEVDLGRGSFKLKVRPEPANLKMGIWYQGRAFVEAIYNRHSLSPLASDLHDHARSLELVERLQRLDSLRS